MKLAALRDNVRHEEAETKYAQGVVDLNPTWPKAAYYLGLAKRDLSRAQSALREAEILGGE